MDPGLDWQLPFNTSKCKILHLETFIPKHQYVMFGSILEEVTEEGILYNR